MPIDMERMSQLAALFHLVEQAQGHPKLKAIGDEAMKHLEEYAASLQPLEPEAEPEPAPEPEPEAEQPEPSRRY